MSDAKPPLPPRPVPYYTPIPAPRPTGLSAAAIVALIWTLLLTGAMTFVMVFVIPKFEQIFKDFKVSLPGVTKVLLMACRMFNRCYGWLWVWVLPLLVAFVIESIHRARAAHPVAAQRGVRAMFYSAIYLYLLLFLVAIVLWALFAPMITLIGAVSGGGNGR